MCALNVCGYEIALSMLKSYSIHRLSEIQMKETCNNSVQHSFPIPASSSYACKSALYDAQPHTAALFISTDGTTYWKRRCDMVYVFR